MFQFSSVNVCICTSISWYFNKIDQIAFSELEKNSPTISLFFRKMTAEVNYAKRHEDWKFPWYILDISKLAGSNNKKRSHTQLDSRKQVIAFQDRVMTINIKEAQHPLKWEKQVIDKSSIMLKISTKSMHRVLVWEIGPANNTTRCSRLSKRRLLHAWHPSQLAINLSIDKSKWQIHVNNKSD